MNEEIVKDYEVDLKLYLSLGAQARIGEKEKGNEYAQCLNTGMKIAYDVAIYQSLFRLTYLCPTKYPFHSLEQRESYVKACLEDRIKENTNVQ